MSENEVFTLKEMMKEVTDGQKDLSKSFNDMRVDIAERYATKQELKVVDDKIEKSQTKHTGNTFSVITMIIAACAIILTTIGLFVR